MKKLRARSEPKEMFRWPTAVEFLETALENAKKIRGEIK